MTPPTAPGFTKEQVEYLERSFPNQGPDITWTNRAVWVSVGKAAVAVHVRSLYERQVERELKGSTT